MKATDVIIIGALVYWAVITVVEALDLNTELLIDVIEKSRTSGVL